MRIGAPTAGIPDPAFLSPVVRADVASAGRQQNRLPSWMEAGADPFIEINDSIHGTLVIDLYREAARYDTPPSYRLNLRGAIETDRTPRKGNIVDLLA